MTADDVIVTIRDGGMSATVHLPGIAVKDIHKPGVNVFNAVATIMRTKYWLWMNPDFFVHKNKMDGSTMIFILTQLFTVTEDFYTVANRNNRIKEDYLKGPFELVSWVGQTGKSSFVWNLCLYDVISKALLVSEQSVSVCVCAETRKSKPIAANLKDLAARNPVEELIPPIKWSKDNFVSEPHNVAAKNLFQKVIKESDLDEFGHVTYRVYLDYATRIIEQKWYDLKYKPLQCAQLSVLYEHEAVLGELLDFEVNRLKNTDTVIVKVTKNKTPIVTIRFEDCYDIKHCDGKETSML